MEALINSPASRRGFRRLASSTLINIAPLCLFASPRQTTKSFDGPSGLLNQCFPIRRKKSKIGKFFESFHEK